MLHAPTGAILLALAALPAAAAPASTPASGPAGAPRPTLEASPGHPQAGAVQRHRPKVVEHYVDINSAGRTELMTLPGVGRAEADKIIANRPYLSKTELVTKQVLLVGPYLSLKDQIVAMQKFKPKAKG